MGVVVQKYGGSSVADVGGLRKVAKRIIDTKRQGHDVVVVVSAMGDTTDELLALAKQVSPNPERRELDMLLTAGERIAMALLSMAIRERGGDQLHRQPGGHHHRRSARPVRLEHRRRRGECGNRGATPTGGGRRAHAVHRGRMDPGRQIPGLLGDRPRHGRARVRVGSPYGRLRRAGAGASRPAARVGRSSYHS